jgi:hypothetical protein
MAVDKPCRCGSCRCGSGHRHSHGPSGRKNLDTTGTDRCDGPCRRGSDRARSRRETTRGDKASARIRPRRRPFARREGGATVHARPIGDRGSGERRRCRRSARGSRRCEYQPIARRARGTGAGSLLRAQIVAAPPTTARVTSGIPARDPSARRPRISPIAGRERGTGAGYIAQGSGLRVWQRRQQRRGSLQAFLAATRAPGDRETGQFGHPGMMPR